MRWRAPRRRRPNVPPSIRFSGLSPTPSLRSIPRSSAARPAQNGARALVVARAKARKVKPLGGGGRLARALYRMACWHCLLSIADGGQHRRVPRHCQVLQHAIARQDVLTRVRYGGVARSVAARPCAGNSLLTTPGFRAGIVVPLRGTAAARRAAHKVSVARRLLKGLLDTVATRGS